MVTHPFHPWRGRQYELLYVRQDWGEWRVAFFDEEQRWRSLPVAWTSVAPLDAFVQVAAGRSPLRFADLLRLSQLAGSLAHDHGEGEGQ